MWLNLDDKEIAIIKFALASAIGDGPAVDHGAAIIAKIQANEAENPLDAAYRNAVETNDELEVDDDAIVSLGADPGAWVHAWVWVTNEQIGITDIDDADRGDANNCRTCGEKYDPYGDGYDGECPDCADKTYAKEFPEEAE
ncbi:MAG: hypothetical protein M9895_04360 [Aquamicrobium sp.]|uniref:hypothetical protein n=1 Tax=Aquamicrobium sp. TaxID=1872579 RepID=UPI00349E8E2A|nr:hypothetical protein [Aquamicrobium sp.]MCO5157944.1 hypothetical protein [Aquamicrobium sp.]